MGKLRKTATLLLATTMIATMLSACGAPAPTPAVSDSATATPEATATASASAEATSAAASSEAAPDPSALDISKAEEMNFILVGPEAKDAVSVVAELNKLSQKDLNLTVNYTFLGWENLGNKYNLILSSGEKADMIYTATWNNFQTLARKGAYLPIEELLPKYAPLSWEGMSKDAWKTATLNGHIYTVPCDWKELMSNGFAYRMDIAEKVGITEPITSLEQLDAYLAACKKAYPDVIPFNASATELNASLVNVVMGKYEEVSGRYASAASNDEPKIINFFETPEFQTACEFGKKAYDSGYWSKNILSNKNSADGPFIEGKTFVCKQNITQTSALYTNCIKDHPDWKIGFFGQMDANGGILHPNVPIGNGVALPKACSDPARALAYVDKLRYDSKYYTLSNYGIEGKHFDIDAATGAPVYKGSADAIGFGYQSMQPWGWHIDKMELPVANQWPMWKTIYDKYEKTSTFPKYGAFAFDSTAVSAEKAALDNVVDQYYTILIAGKSKDIPGDIKILNDKLKAAGLEKFTAEIQKQLDAYWKEMGY